MLAVIQVVMCVTVYTKSCRNLSGNVSKAVEVLNILHLSEQKTEHNNSWCCCIDFCNFCV